MTGLKKREELKRWEVLEELGKIKTMQAMQSQGKLEE